MKTEKLADVSIPCCACTQIKWYTETDPSTRLTHGWWACKDCGRRFIPQVTTNYDAPTPASEVRICEKITDILKPLIYSCGYGHHVNNSDGAEFECQCPDVEEYTCDDCPHNGTRQLKRPQPITEKQDNEFNDIENIYKVLRLHDTRITNIEKGGGR